MVFNEEELCAFLDLSVTGDVNSVAESFRNKLLVKVSRLVMVELIGKSLDGAGALEVEMVADQIKPANLRLKS